MSGLNECCWYCKTQTNALTNGWRFLNGTFAKLCQPCSIAYENDTFCLKFHQFSDGWRDCKICGKYIHCGCRISLHLYEALDSGGVGCLKCTRQAMPLVPINPSLISSPGLSLSVTNPSGLNNYFAVSNEMVSGTRVLPNMSKIPWAGQASEIHEPVAANNLRLSIDLSLSQNAFQIGEPLRSAFPSDEVIFGEAVLPKNNPGTQNKKQMEENVLNLLEKGKAISVSGIEPNLSLSLSRPSEPIMKTFQSSRASSSSGAKVLPNNPVLPNLELRPSQPNKNGRSSETSAIVAVEQKSDHISDEEASRNQMKENVNTHQVISGTNEVPNNLVLPNLETSPSPRSEPNKTFRSSEKSSESIVGTEKKRSSDQISGQAELSRPHELICPEPKWFYEIERKGSHVPLISPFLSNNKVQSSSSEKGTGKNVSAFYPYTQNNLASLGSDIKPCDQPHLLVNQQNGAKKSMEKPPPRPRISVKMKSGSSTKVEKSPEMIMPPKEFPEKPSLSSDVTIPIKIGKTLIRSTSENNGNRAETHSVLKVAEIPPKKLTLKASSGSKPPLSSSQIVNDPNSKTGNKDFPGSSSSSSSFVSEKSTFSNVLTRAPTIRLPGNLIELKQKTVKKTLNPKKTENPKPSAKTLVIVPSHQNTPVQKTRSVNSLIGTPSPNPVPLEKLTGKRKRIQSEKRAEKKARKLIIGSPSNPIIIDSSPNPSKAGPCPTKTALEHSPNPKTKFSSIPTVVSTGFTIHELPGPCIVGIGSSSSLPDPVAKYCERCKIPVSFLRPIFEKKLSIDEALLNSSRLILPDDTLQAFTAIVKEGKSIKVEDTSGEEWEFRYTYWRDGKTLLYGLDGLRPYSSKMRWRPGDLVTFYKVEPNGKLIIATTKVEPDPA